MDAKDKCEHINAIKIAELEKRLQMHVAYQKEAVDRAASDLHERLATMNEFREQLKEQASRFVTRDELTLQLEALTNRIAWIVGIIITVIGLVAYLLK